MATIAIRNATAGDLNYLRSNFANSFKHSGYANGTSNEVLRTLLDPLLASWTTLIATPVDDSSVILAWLLFRDPTTVAWVHVRPEIRRKGIAAQLLAHAGIVKGELLTPFLPTKLEGAEGSFSNLSKAHGYTLRYRPYLPLQIALDDARALAEVVL